MKIGIIGLGLIGGSLGYDLRSLGHQVLGASRRQETCQAAIALGAVDQASTDFTPFATADVIFICTPLHAIQSTVEQLIPHLQPSAVLTDVGSVKTSIVRVITPLWSNFVGGHPMAGTAEAGIAAAQPELFAHRPYVLTPTETTPVEALDVVATIARSLQSQLYCCSPEAHDRAVAWISHLPVFTSASLIAACLGEPDAAISELAQNLASSGFRDTSRVGGGNPELGQMMAQYNRVELLRSLQHYRQSLDQFMTQIEQEDWLGLEEQLNQTQQGRLKFIRPEDS